MSYMLSVTHLNGCTVVLQIPNRWLFFLHSKPYMI